MRIPRCRDRLLDVALPSLRVHHCVLTGEASMHDIVIRGGTIVDGTGKVAFTGDAPARSEVYARGALRACARGLGAFRSGSGLIRAAG